MTIAAMTAVGWFICSWISAWVLFCIWRAVQRERRR